MYCDKYWNIRTWDVHAVNKTKIHKRISNRCNQCEAVFRMEFRTDAVNGTLYFLSKVENIK